MIDDHKTSVESACETARDILTHTDDPREKQLVSSDVDKLMSHWTAISALAASQLTAVDAALAASSEYQSRADPFCEWLDSTEKKVAGLELATVDTAAIQQQIGLQRVGNLLSCIGPIQIVMSTFIRQRQRHGNTIQSHAIALLDKLKKNMKRHYS